MMAPSTLLEALIRKLRGGNVHGDAEEAPVAILWTDPRSEWQVIQAEIERLALRIEKRLDAGWRSVKIVKNHGWLFCPDGLPTAAWSRQHLLCPWRPSPSSAGGACAATWR